MNKTLRRLIWLSAMFLAVSLLTRIGLALFSQESYSLSEWGRFLGMGEVFDLTVLPFFLLPWSLYEIVRPQKRLLKWEGRWAMVWGTGYLVLFVVTAASEFVFWNEFSTRFDFIAVDYLVYTHEVIGNIRESYPVFWWLSALFLVCGMLAWLTWPKENGVGIGRLTRIGYSLVLVLAIVAGYFGVDMGWTKAKNAYVQQLSNNGFYALFHAYRHNQLDYAKYYPTLPQDRLNDEIRSLVKQPNAAYTSTHGIERNIEAVEVTKKPNIVLISVESLSAEFMAHFGNEQNLTPELDKLADQSLFFTNLFATGTRTVRGLEALSVGTPPTPGQSIVRRPNNQRMENLGEELREAGWAAPYWIYGGYGFFDNMNAFFASNGYQVVDRTDSENMNIEIHAENVWGIADEDLFTMAMQVFDKQASKDKPFFAHIMTTSNHRPYTFPENRVDLPQKKREGAVKYTDWALGDFIKRSAKKAWFDNTIFIILADHTSKAAGKTDLPLWRYRIPMIWYAPKLIEPQKMDRLMSQIDVGPSLMGWLGLSYSSRFFGYDIFHLEPGRERAFISTYQKLGYLKNDRLVVLDVNKPAKVMEANRQETVIADPQEADKKLIDEAVAWYQSASKYFLEGLLTEKESKNES